VVEGLGEPYGLWVYSRFLWIVENAGTIKRDELDPEYTRKARSGTITVTPKFKKIVASVKDVAPVTGRSLEKARGMARS